MPLGILYLSAYIKRHCELNRVGIIDYVANFGTVKKYNNIDEFIDRIAKNSVGYTPDVILISLNFSISHDFYINVVNVLKNIWPQSTVIVGGAHATNDTEGLLENENIAYVARGEGEIGLSQFLNQYANRNPIDVKGFYSIDDNCSGKQLEVCDFIYNLDEIPFPDWDLIEVDSYITEIYITIQNTQRDESNSKKCAPILTARGCPGRCTYCSQHTVHGRGMRYRSVEKVIEEMNILHERYGVKVFVPHDDMFISKKTRDLELLARIQNLNIEDLELQLPNALNINRLDQEVMEALIEAGVKIVHLAIESGSDYVQKIIKKHVNLIKAKEIVDYFRSKSVYVRCYFILGFPHETREQMMQTIKYAQSLNADWSDFNIAIPLIGSEMYDQFCDLGYIDTDNPDWSGAYVLGRTFDTKIISAKEIQELAYRANLESNFLNNINKRQGKYKKAISLYESVLVRYPFHVIAWYSKMDCYKAMGDKDKTEEAEQTILKLIQKNPLAKDMYDKYKDLMPEVRQDKLF